MLMLVLTALSSTYLQNWMYLEPRFDLGLWLLLSVELP